MVGALSGDGKYVDIPKHTSHSCAFVCTFIPHVPTIFPSTVSVSNPDISSLCVYVFCTGIANRCLYGTHKHAMGKASRFETTKLNVLHMYMNEFSELIRKIVIVHNFYLQGIIAP